MKRSHLHRLILGAALVALPAAVQAQVTPAAGYTPPDDTPTVKVGGTIYADYTYTDSPEAKDTDGNLINPSAFNVSRAYVNVTGNISHLVSYRITPDVRLLSTSSKLAPGETISTSVDGSLVFRVKYAFGQVNLDQWTTKGTWVRLGAQQTPIIDYLEGIYRYRFQGTVFANRETSPGGQPFLDSSDFGLSGHYNLPSNYGDLHVGYYNGEYFGRNDPNNQKSFQVRGTLRPFATGSPVLRGLRLTAFYNADKYVNDAPRNRFLANATFEHKYVNAGFEYLKAKDQTSIKAPAIEAEGWSAWATPRTTKGWEALLRYDSLKPNTSVDGRKNRTILGVAYWFKTIANSAQAALLVDMDQAKYDAVLNKPTERKYALHCLFNF